MESRAEKAENFLNAAWEELGVDPEVFEMERQRVEEDMYCALQLLVRWGDLTEEEADQRMYDWREKYGRNN